MWLMDSNVIKHTFQYILIKGKDQWSQCSPTINSNFVDFTLAPDKLKQFYVFLPQAVLVRIGGGSSLQP